MSYANWEPPLISKANRQGSLLVENEDTGEIVRLEWTADWEMKTSNVTLEAVDFATEAKQDDIIAWLVDIEINQIDWSQKTEISSLAAWISTNSNTQLNVTSYDKTWVAVCDMLDWPNVTCAAWRKPLISEVAKVNKFGNAPDFDTWDWEVTVWDWTEDTHTWQLMNYVYSATADIDSISSENAGDTVDMEIQGIDTNWDLVVQTITLTWQTRAALTTSLKRVFRAKNVWSTNLVWHVFIYVNWATTWWVPDTNADIRAVTHPENNQTEMAIYTIPTWKTWYIRQIYANSSWGSRATKYIIRVKTRPAWQVFQLKYKWAFDDDSQLEKSYEVLLWGFSAMTDIEMTAEITASWVTAANVIWWFDIILVDN